MMVRPTSNGRLEFVSWRQPYFTRCKRVALTELTKRTYKFASILTRHKFRAQTVLQPRGPCRSC